MADTNGLDAFDDPVVFRDIREMPDYAPVDPRGFEELDGHWPVNHAGLREYMLWLRARGQRVSYMYLFRQRMYMRLRNALVARGEMAARRLLAQQMREVYRLTDPDLTDEQIYEQLCHFVQEARNAVTWFNERYLPDTLTLNLTSEGALERRRDPIEMICEIANRPLSMPPTEPGARDPDQLMRILLFRMRRDLALAQRLFGISVHMRRIYSDRFAPYLTDVFEKRFFEPGMLREAQIWAVVDAESGRPLRIIPPESSDIGPGERLEILPLSTRYFRISETRRGEQGKLFPVFFNPAGAKNPWDTLFKMMARGKTDPWTLNDLLRGEFIFMNERHLALGIEVMCDRVFTAPWSVRSIDDTRQYRPERQARNPESSKEYRVVRMDVLMDGIPAELQLHDRRNAIYARTSRGPVSHRRYKLRTVMKILHILHPESIFRVKWNHPRIREQIMAD